LRPDKRKEEAREVERGRKEEAGSEWGPSESSQRGERRRGGGGRAVEEGGSKSLRGVERFLWRRRRSASGA